MGGDYTRFSFDPAKGYTGVRLQQGRVSLDADGNEMIDIADRRQRAQLIDLVGRGVATADEAFKIGVSNGEITIGIGRAYVDGILVECRGDMTVDTRFDPSLGEVVGTRPLPYAAQPFRYTPSYPALTGTQPHVVYLDVWQREVTVLEDPSLREEALNGAETTTRVQTVWQAKARAFAGLTTCAGTSNEWDALVAPSEGRLSVFHVMPPPNPSTCTIEPKGGYTGLENRLYRVEVHSGGRVGDGVPPKLKWSRDNASLTAGVIEITPGGAGEVRVTLTSLGRDKELRLAAGDFIELLDDDLEFSMRDRNAGGPIAKILSVPDPDTPVVVVAAADVAGFTVAAARHPRVRRWDTAPGATTALRSITPAAAGRIALESGIEIAFNGGMAGVRLRAGDYWTFAARTTSGTVEQLRDAPPQGILHHYCRLAVVTAPATAEDCRETWPPQFGGAAPTPACGCTVCVKPGMSLQEAVDSLPPSGGEICLAAGLYTVDQPVRVIGRERLVLSGAGPATVIRAVASEAALRFERCREVEIHHLRVEGGTGDVQLDGGVTFVDCTDVSVVDCELACPDAAGRAQTCITVRSERATDTSRKRRPRKAPARSPIRVSIEGNRLEVGAWQTGILLVDVERALVAANHVRLGPVSADGWPNDRHGFVAGEVESIVTGALRDVAAPGAIPIRMRRSNVVFHVARDDKGAEIVREFARLARPGDLASEKKARLALGKFARGTATGAGLGDVTPAARKIIQGIVRDNRAGGQGIVVAGRELGTVQVLDNVVEGMVQGIHIGTSHAEVSGREIALEVMVARNVVHAVVPVRYRRDRHGIFVANARSIHILDTVASLQRIGKVGKAGEKDGDRGTPVDGIRVQGRVGPFLVVRHSSLRDFDVGVSALCTGMDGGGSDLAHPWDYYWNSKDGEREVQREGHLWLVAETMAVNGRDAARVSARVETERNYFTPP